MRRGRLKIPVDNSIALEEIIPLNEIVFDFDTKKLLIGDGATPAKHLPEINPFFSPALLTTSNATVTVIATVNLPDNSAGIIELRMCAVYQTGTETLIEVKQYAYQKVGGALTLSSASVPLYETFGSATIPSWQAVDNSDVLEVQVTGVAATDIDWKLHYKVNNIQFTYVIP